VKTIAQCLSWCSLVGVAAAAWLFFADHIDLAATKRWMLVATVVWFIAAPLWMEHKARE
jgi:hypothetical protein